MELECPFCGFRGKPSDFYFVYESVLYVADSKTVPEERSRPVLVVCPVCGNGFFLESPYKALMEKMKSGK
ncbi:hypothetical protein TCELL_0814 [Thermogladius calderae 1633]|uniref:Uncharacterized protein n=1 Tax=Thermogladius calderae (strain DSM 22663 / VKM B-2946 / 1633) TaxID=1184251 RepID=I3TEQ0_THEC1|nr:hypothetical protein [Thermogladius calderae]AFK51238.1 hypothetical protein TCELL_0814 [Thermogladius calderae 1633]